MKKLTKTQRRKVYLEVAKDLFVIHEFLCIALEDYGNMDDFIEFNLFNPRNPRFKVWFGVGNGIYTEEDKRNARIICMLLCYEMCNDNKQKSPQQQPRA